MLAFNTLDESEKEGRAGGAASLRALRGGGEAAGGGISIRPMEDFHAEGVQRLREVVRWSADPEAFELLRGFRGACWAVAEGGAGEMAGMVGAVPLGRIGILCHLAVHHDHRRGGLGASLSRWAISYLRSRGVSMVRLYSTGRAENMYRSLGFEGRFRRVVYRIEGLSEAALDPTARARGLSDARYAGLRAGTLTVGDLTELYGVDRWSFGGDRSALIWAALQRHPGRGIVARDASGRIKGYIIRSAEQNGTGRLGPFMAATPAVARALLAHALDANSEGPVEVAVTGSGPAHEVLRGFGFVGREDRLRMELGAGPHFSGLTEYGTTPYLAT